MARIRTIKPEFWTSDQVVECSTNARLMFIGLWNFCDDGGVHPDSAKRIKMEIFPADAMTEDDIERLLGELIDAELLVRFESEGKSYLAVTGWQHQKIETPTYRYPSPNGRRTLVERSENVHPRNRKGREGSLRSDIGADHAREISEPDAAEAIARVQAIHKAAGVPQTPQDRTFAARVALLSFQAPFSEAWLHGALQGLRLTNGRKRKPYAYLTDCLKESASKLKRDLRTELRKISPPYEIANPPPAILERLNGSDHDE